jgi:3-methyladenine DNA glycosylase Tag
VKNHAWTYLYNCLYLTSSSYKELEPLESSILQVLDELETNATVGLNQKYLDSYQEEGLINLEIKDELSRFRDFIFNIDSKHWNPKDFDHAEDWQLARKWANSLMKKMNLKKRGFDDHGIVIYTDL